MISGVNSNDNQSDNGGENQGRKGLLKGAVWIAIGGFVAKLIGGLYRIPLTNAIGGRGLGLYQLGYSVYCLFLTVATGIPSSVSKLTAEKLGQGQSAEPLFKRAMKLFLSVGLAASALMAILAPFIARAQGGAEVLWGYYALAPAVALVSVISVFRGYFQGKNDMMPTAIISTLSKRSTLFIKSKRPFGRKAILGKALSGLMPTITSSRSSALSERASVPLMIWSFS